MNFNLFSLFNGFGMKGRISKPLLLLPLLMIALTLLACSGGEPESAKQAGKGYEEESAKQGGGSGQAAVPEGHPTMYDTPSYAKLSPEKHANVKSTRKVEVSDEIKAKWKSVELEVSDNSTGVKETMKVDIGSSVKLGESGFSLKAEVFLPHYTVFDDENYIGSRSNDPVNPALQVALYEGDKLVSDGWVFEEMTQYNSFSNLRFSVVLLPVR